MIIDRKIKAAQRRDALLVVLFVAVWFSFVGTIIFVAAHFIMKFW